jgi:hypothetical protein
MRIGITVGPGDRRPASISLKGLPYIGDCLLSYAGQLAARPATRYVRFTASADQDASPAEVLEFAQAGAGILAATVRTASPRQASKTVAARARVGSGQ